MSTTVALYRENLVERFKDIPVKDVKLEHCRLSINEVYAASNIVFVDGKLCKILKAKDYEVTVPNQRRVENG